MSASDWQQLAPTHVKLQSFYGEVRSAMASPWVQLTEAATSGINSQFTSIARRIAGLGAEGRIGQGVINGTVTPQAWVKQANDVGADLRSITQQIDEEGLLKLAWTDFVVPTAKDVKVAAQNVVDTGTPILALIVIGLVALVALKVLR